jgi:hypothetical protein
MPCWTFACRATLVHNIACAPFNNFLPISPAFGFQFLCLTASLDFFFLFASYLPKVSFVN